MLYQRALRPVLFRASRGDPERAHEQVLRGLAIVSRSPQLTRSLAFAAALAVPGAFAEHAAVDVFGLHFPNPIGLAAGFDKNAAALPALAALGFGFIEAGTITSHAQPGNPRPRLFRLAQDHALINRMGFNNAGAAAVAESLKRLPPLPVPLGISLGKSKVTPLDDAIDDYLDSLIRVYPHADYLAVNVSSPNTPGLRALQERDRLDALLAALAERLMALAADEERGAPKPLLVKVSPDLDEAALDEVVAVCKKRGASGLIAVNTSTGRDGLASAGRSAEVAQQPGGLSGAPLRKRALQVVGHLHAAADGTLPIIGCGGVFTAEDARALLDAGASLVQLYTSFIYEGPLIARRIAAGLAQ